MNAYIPAILGLVILQLSQLVNIIQEARWPPDE